MHFKEEIKYIISSKTFSISKKRPKVLKAPSTQKKITFWEAKTFN